MAIETLPWCKQVAAVVNLTTVMFYCHIKPKSKDDKVSKPVQI